MGLQNADTSGEIKLEEQQSQIHSSQNTMMRSTNSGNIASEGLYPPSLTVNTTLPHCATNSSHDWIHQQQQQHYHHYYYHHHHHHPKTSTGIIPPIASLSWSTTFGLSSYTTWKPIESRMYENSGSCFRTSLPAPSSSSTIHAEYPSIHPSKPEMTQNIKTPSVSPTTAYKHQQEEGQQPQMEREDIKRQLFLEKNRKAASKCRQKKKEWLAQMQNNVELFSEENEKLQQQVIMLREEVVGLKTLLFTCKECPQAQANGVDGLSMTPY
ncbi:uncharacterized protein BX664DRAFT_327326 [Halteromyces radiatus]|uniref:uncharacterized protein n=1 Tax=Halteromyces radiatus TaxID=101107 RepID=UPI00221E8509|nr:uncharacterized protein BX664DRAFT_327326 [Halteromyces radiatus]KAI8092462.1 hypothetical protein BX664DRAFT_327326 [Halteromyces radiatus]